MNVTYFMSSFIPEGHGHRGNPPSLQNQLLPDMTSTALQEVGERHHIDIDIYRVIDLLSIL